jgi:hypothetical protein
VIDTGFGCVVAAQLEQIDSIDLESTKSRSPHTGLLRVCGLISRRYYRGCTCCGYPAYKSPSIEVT